MPGERARLTTGWGDVTPGTSALFLLSSDAVMDRVAAEFNATHAELISTNLSAAQETQLRGAFGHEED